MSEPIQDLIEQTAQRLKRSVAVDDPELELLGSSKHFEEVDEARLSSLVGRKVPGPLRDYVMAEGARTWQDVTVLPARPELGFELDRLCFPLRSRFGLLGYMWIIGTELLGDEMEIAREGAERIRQSLALRAQSSAEADSHAERLVAALLSSDPTVRRQAAQDMQDRAMFLGFTRFVSIVVATDPERRSSFGETPAVIVRRAVASATRDRWREAYAIAAGNSESTVILGFREAADLDAVRSLAHTIHHEIRSLDPSLAAATVVGIGEAQVPLESINESHAQASIAVKVGRARGDSVVVWSDHPTDALLGAMLKTEVEKFLIPTALRHLEGPGFEQTRELLESFLNHAGNVIRTADELHLHRTTVYYRIRKFQETTGLDLDDGSTRLLLHFWLSTRRFVDTS